MSRVLLSSEDPLLITELKRQARAMGVQLIAAGSATTLEQTRQLVPAVLIIDLQQRIDGRLLLARLKQDPRTSFLRIAAVSGRVDERLNRFCREMRVAAYDQKPLRQSYLATLLEGARPLAAAGC